MPRSMRGVEKGACLPGSQGTGGPGDRLSAGRRSRDRLGRQVPVPDLGGFCTALAAAFGRALGPCQGPVSPTKGHGKHAQASDQTQYSAQCCSDLIVDMIYCSSSSSLSSFLAAGSSSASRASAISSASSNSDSEATHRVLQAKAQHANTR